MRKTILMGLGLALSVAGTVAAQQTDQVKPRRPQAEGERGEGRRGGPDGFLLKDITLTDAQKTQLKALRTAEREKMQANREQMRKQFEEMRSARERGDTAAARAIMQRNRQAMEQNREQHLAAIRNILTAEQRTQFDRNVAELKQRHQERGARGERFGPRDQRGPRAGMGWHRGR